MKWLCYSIFWLFSMYEAKNQSFVSAMADRYQFASVCLDVNTPGKITGRHPALKDPVSLAAAFYGENSLVPGGKKYFSVQGLLPLAEGSFNVQTDYGGSGGFSEMQAGIGYSRSLGPVVQIGARFNYYQLRITGYGSSFALPAECGVVFQLMPKLRTSLYIYNLMAAKPNKDGLSRIPTVVRIGTGYSIAESVGIVMEIIKEFGQPVSFQPVLFYQAQEKLFFRGGLATGTRSVFVSGGYQAGRMRVDLSTAYKGILGWTAGLGVQFLGNEKKSK
jgi:hypothetical protein